MKAQSGSRSKTTLSLTSAQDKVGGQHHTAFALPPRKQIRNLWYRRLGGPQSTFWRAQNSRTSPGFDPQTVQAVASSYTDCIIAAAT